eukprot:GILJ01009669.1.p1 GENE.GILJ01009669.1~~GILJ01009669.1.p1  ORF type:complete len:1596 (+),score=195.01 GILJ01009669.1:607-4788(+)
MPVALSKDVICGVSSLHAFFSGDHITVKDTDILFEGCQNLDPRCSTRPVAVYTTLQECKDRLSRCIVMTDEMYSKHSMRFVTILTALRCMNVDVDPTLDSSAAQESIRHDHLMRLVLYSTVLCCTIPLNERSSVTSPDFSRERISEDLCTRFDSFLSQLSSQLLVVVRVILDVTDATRDFNETQWLVDILDLPLLRVLYQRVVEQENSDSSLKSKLSTVFELPYEAVYLQQYLEWLLELDSELPTFLPSERECRKGTVGDVEPSLELSRLNQLNKTMTSELEHFLTPMPVVTSLETSCGNPPEGAELFHWHNKSRIHPWKYGGSENAEREQQLKQHAEALAACVKNIRRLDLSRGSSSRQTPVVIVHSSRMLMTEITNRSWEASERVAELSAEMKFEAAIAVIDGCIDHLRANVTHLSELSDHFQATGCELNLVKGDIYIQWIDSLRSESEMGNKRKKRLTRVFDSLLCVIVELSLRFIAKLPHQKLKRLLKAMAEGQGNFTKIAQSAAYFIHRLPRCPAETRKMLHAFIHKSTKRVGALNTECHASFCDFFVDIFGHEISWESLWGCQPEGKALEYKERYKLHFAPDEWQRQLIDSVNKNESVLVTAPTSSGKTFIAMYAIEKVLRESEDGIVVFVCPSKALVSQVYVDVYSRFEKNYQEAHRRMLGLFTADDKIHVLNCQVLVTVAQCLEILLLSPVHHEWRRKLRLVIFDEIHSVGEESGGVVWEHLLSLIDCPFLGLSATIGNAPAFVDWLNTLVTQRSCKPVVHVTTDRRSTDLKYFSFNDDLVSLHPWAMVKDSSVLHAYCHRLAPMLPDQLLEMYDVLKRALSTHSAYKDEIIALSPGEYFQDMQLFRQRFAEYEKSLLHTLSSVLRPDSPHQEAKQALCHEWNRFSQPYVNSLSRKTGDSYIARNIGQLLQVLHTKNALPVLVFCLRKTFCEALAKKLCACSETLSFLRLSPHDINTKALKHGVAFELHAALKHGIGVHHSGLSKQYRLEVERLFRSQKLKLIIATGTLGVGLHMPCKSVVFAGYSPHLTAVQYFQMQGRAGRRGYEAVGNVIFFGFSPQQISRFMTAELPTIRGHMPLDTSTVLRLMTLVKECPDAAARDSIMRLLQVPFFCHRRVWLLDQVKHQFRFALWFLKNTSIIDNSGRNNKWAPIVTHLSYCEPSNILFVHLLPLLRTTVSSHEQLLLILAHLFVRIPSRNGKGCLESLPNAITEAIGVFNKIVYTDYSNYLAAFATYLPPSKPTLPLSLITISGTLTQTTTSPRAPFATVFSAHAPFQSITDIAFNVRPDILIDPFAVPVVECDNHWKNYIIRFYHGDTSPVFINATIEKALEDFHKILRKLHVVCERVLGKEESLVLQLYQLITVFQTRLAALKSYEGISDDSDDD